MPVPERARASHGFTLVEAVIVIAITGILAAIVAVFIRAPVQGYFDSARRALLSDAADNALRRMARDLRLAVPNSVRVTAAGGVTYIELLLTRGGGRYRTEPTAAGAGNPLAFDGADTSFDIIGPVPAVSAGDHLVIGNLGPGTGADAYAGDNRATVAGIAGSTLSFASLRFPVPSPGARFLVVEGPVTFACNPAAGTLTRHAAYAIVTAQPTPPAGGTSALLAAGVSACSFTYDPLLPNTRSGLVSLLLSLASQGETVQMFHEVHVANVP